MTPARRIVAVLVVAAGVWLLAAAGTSARVFGGIDHFAQDLLQPGVADAVDVVVVGIDRRTLVDVHGWPWPRGLHAQLLDEIGAGDPRLVVYDVLFADPGAFDDELHAALERTPTVLTSALILDLARGGPPAVLDETPPVEPLSEAAAGVGFANVAPTVRQGVVRALPGYAVGERGLPVPSLALAGAAGGRATIIERTDGVQVGAVFVPLDSGMLRVNFSADLDVGSVVSAADILAGRVEVGTFTGRVVVVGVTEPTLGDLHMTPLDRTGATPGVIIHANALNTILTRSYLDPVGRTAELVLLAVLALAAAALVAGPRLAVAAAGSLGLVVGVLAFTSWRFHAAGGLWPVTWPVLVVGGVLAAGTGWRYHAETRHRRLAQDLFARYVPDDIVGQLARPDRIREAIAGRRVEVAVLFCDLRGFTPLSAELAPEAVRELLDVFYTRAVAIVHRHGGTVMQFIGDEVFAIFGAPVEVEDRVGAALAAAVELADGAEDLNAELAERGLPPVRYGIGVNDGEVLAAHLGTNERRQYTVVGDTVNVASRFCSAAEAGQVVTTVELAERCGVSAEPIGPVRLKGVDRPVALCRVR